MDQSKKRQYQCSACHKVFNRPSALRTHMYTHTGEKPFECDTPGCGRRFAVISNLRRHYKVHRKVVEQHHRIPAGERMRFVQRLMDRCNKLTSCDNAQAPLDTEPQPWWLPSSPSPTSSTSSCSSPYSQLPKHPRPDSFSSSGLDSTLDSVRIPSLARQPINLRKNEMHLGSHV